MIADAAVLLVVVWLIVQHEIERHMEARVRAAAPEPPEPATRRPAGFVPPPKETPRA